jgi:hypothetical protein
MRSGKHKNRRVANALFEHLEARQLLSVAVHTAVQKALSSQSALTAARHHVHHVGPPTPSVSTAASSAAATPAVTTAAVVSPSATTVTPGLNDYVYHGNAAYPTGQVPNPNPNASLTNGTLGGTNAAVASAVAYAASHTPNYSFVNSNDSFVYGGGSGALTANFLNNNAPPTAGGSPGYGNGYPGDATGAALTDPANVNDTIFDAEGYFQTPTGNDAGTYTVALGGVDDLVAVYMGGNGTAGSGTLVASNGWQGANAGTITFTVPATSDTTDPESVPVEILYANGYGGANLNAVSGSNPSTGVEIIDSSSIQVISFQTTATNEPVASAPTLSGTAGNNSVALNWTSASFAQSYSVYRYLASASPTTATQLSTGITGLTYTDSTAQNNQNYDYYVTADNAGGSTPSNTITESPVAGATGPVTQLTASRTNATTVQLSFTAPQFGTNYTVTRSTTLGGTQTTLTPAGGQTGTTFTDSNAPTTSNTNYYYTVTSVNSAGPSPAVTVFVGQGDGWAADYYKSDTADPAGDGNEKPLTGDDSTPGQAAVLSFERIDASPVVNPVNPPPNWNVVNGTNNGTNDYAVRWTGYVEAPVTGYYSFGETTADDREHITVFAPDGVGVDLTPAAYGGYAGYSGGTSYLAPVVDDSGNAYQFTAGQKYLVQIDYNQGNGGVNANISYAAASTAANAAAGTNDLMAQQAVPTYNVLAPTPAFSTVDASGTVTKDQGYYTFTSQASNTAVQLQWNNVPADSYNLYRSSSAAGPYAPVNPSPIAAPTTGAPVTYLDSGLTNGTKYYYILTGVDVNGKTAVTLSNGTTSGLTTSATPLAIPPATPTGVIAIGTNSTTTGVQGHISFPAVSQANSYIIQRAPETTPGSGTPGTFATVPGGGAVTGTGSTITFVDSDPSLKSTANYFYQVIAVNGALQSAASSPAEMKAVGALAAEGPVEVDVRAAAYPSGTTSTIANAGNQGGVFNAVGGAITVGPVADANGTTYQAFQFNGANSASSSFNSPADLNGNSSRSIELWVDNPTIDNNEESMVSWAHRGGNPDGSNMSFSYGSAYGVGLWGGEYDLQWTNTAPGVTGTGAPAANTWHYLVFTSDGANDNVYVDGQLYLQMPIANGALATFAGFPVNLAAQNSATVSGFAAALNGSLDLASVRIEGGALTASDVQNNFVAGVPGRPLATAAPTTAPTLNPLPTNGQLTLTWSYDPNAFSYDVYRSDPAHPTPVAIATGVTSLTYTDTAITPGTTYTYYVTSVNNIGQGPHSNTESGSVKALTTAPTLSTLVPGNNTLTLNWSADPNAASYDVYRSDPGHTTPVAVATGLTVLTYTDSTVVNGTPYTYYVTSVNSVGQGPPSNTETATPTAPGPFGPLNILTHGADPSNDNLNAAESVLSPTNVNPADFGKQYSDALDGGDVIAEPLYMQNVNITTGANPGVHSVVFIGTEADGLYALDANTGTVLWHDNFTNITSPTTLTPTTGVTTILQSDINGNPDIGSQLGILATPVIDPKTGILYLNANTKEIRSDGKHFVQRLWAVSINSGAAVMSPALIGDTIAPNGLSTTGPYTYVAGPIINGTGNNNPAGQPNPVYPDTDGWTAAPGGKSGYVIAFNAIEQMERTAVSLINGSVYLGFASHGDDGPYYGWVLGYNASTLALNAAFNTTPTFEPSSIVGASQPFQSLGGVWMSGAAIVTDGTNLYLATGNGAFNGDPSNFDANGFPIDHDYGDTLLKLTPDASTATNQNGNGWGLKVSDYFTPSNQFQLNSLDLDLGSSGVTLLPNNVLDAAGNPMLVVGGKESRIYLVDRNNMGKYNYAYPTGASNVNPATYDRVVAEYANNGLNNSGKQIYSSAAYYDGNIYVGVNSSPALEINVAAMASGAAITPVKTTLNFGYPGETFEISADGDSDGIAWALNPGGSDLLAYNAASFGAPIYDSNTTPGDALGGSIHFHVPTVANGMVYAGSRGGGLGGYGLKLTYLDSNPAYFSAPAQLSAVTVSAGDAHLAWTSNSSLATEFRVDRAPAGSTTWTTLAYVGNTDTTYDDTSIAANTAYIYRVVAVSGANTTAASNTATLATLLPSYITPSATASYTWNSTTGALVLSSGTLTFTKDQASSGDTTDPLVKLTANGSGSVVLFQTSQHLAGITLTSGARATVQSLGSARTHSNHNVLVIGALGSSSDPTFSVDSSSKLDLNDNDLIVHTGSSDSNGANEYATVNGLATMGRNPASGAPGNPDGQWNGNGLSSSAANAADAAAGYEKIGLGVVVNSTLAEPRSSWQVGSFNETLGANDIIVKYTYLGDYNLEGAVNADDAGILQIEYDNGKSKTHTWATGSSMGNGLADANEAGLFQIQYGLGTGGNLGPQL